MNDKERLTMVKACKFVDEVVPECPYVMNHEYLDFVVQKYKIDYVVHGDDPCIVDGKDVYATATGTGSFARYLGLTECQRQILSGACCFSMKNAMVNQTGRLGEGPSY